MKIIHLPDNILIHIFLEYIDPKLVEKKFICYHKIDLLIKPFYLKYKDDIHNKINNSLNNIKRKNKKNNFKNNLIINYIEKNNKIIEYYLDDYFDDNKLADFLNKEPKELMNIIHLDFYKYIEKRFEKINKQSAKINIIDNYILASELYNINILKYLLSKNHENEYVKIENMINNIEFYFDNDFSKLYDYFIQKYYIIKNNIDNIQNIVIFIKTNYPNYNNKINKIILKFFIEKLLCHKYNKSLFPESADFAFNNCIINKFLFSFYDFMVKNNIMNDNKTEFIEENNNINVYLFGSLFRDNKKQFLDELYNKKLINYDNKLYQDLWNNIYKNNLSFSTILYVSNKIFNKTLPKFKPFNKNLGFIFSTKYNYNEGLKYRFLEKNVVYQIITDTKVMEYLCQNHWKEINEIDIYNYPLVDNNNDYNHFEWNLNLIKSFYVGTEEELNKEFKIIKLIDFYFYNALFLEKKDIIDVLYNYGYKKNKWNSELILKTLIHLDHQPLNFLSNNYNKKKKIIGFLINNGIQLNTHIFEFVTLTNDYELFELMIKFECPHDEFILLTCAKYGYEYLFKLGYEQKFKFDKRCIQILKDNMMKNKFTAPINMNIEKKKTFTNILLDLKNKNYNEYQKLKNNLDLYENSEKILLFLMNKGVVIN